MKILLGMLETSRQVCWGKLELYSAGHWLFRTEFGDPWFNRYDMPPLPPLILLYHSAITPLSCFLSRLRNLISADKLYHPLSWWCLSNMSDLKSALPLLLSAEWSHSLSKWRDLWVKDAHQNFMYNAECYQWAKPCFVDMFVHWFSLLSLNLRTCLKLFIDG